MMKYFFVLLWFATATSLLAQRNPGWAVPVAAKSVNNLYMVDTGVYRSAQPDAAAFAELEQMGIREALNLRYLYSDKTAAAQTGLTLHHVAMIAGNCDWEKAISALRIIHKRQGAIVIHCKHGADRTGLVVALYRIVFQGWDKERAIDELENGGYQFHPIYANIPSFIRNVNTDALKKAVAQ